MVSDMRTLGIVGGIAPESTVDYYRQILGLWRQRHPDAPNPRIIINSIDVKTVIGFVAGGDLGGLVDYLAPELQRVVAAGADVALFASNTPHLVIDDLRRRASVPLISIVEATGAAAKSLGKSRLGLFGTGFTMRARFYADTFAKQGIAVISPTTDEQAAIHAIYMGELAAAIFKPESRETILGIATTMQRRESLDGLILGGTELPLLLRGSEVVDCPFLDTTLIHVEAAVSRIAGDE
jgi:aspartate racemase